MAQPGEGFDHTAGPQEGGALELGPHLGLDLLRPGFQLGPQPFQPQQLGGLVHLAGRGQAGGLGGLGGIHPGGFPGPAGGLHGFGGLGPGGPGGPLHLPAGQLVAELGPGQFQLQAAFIQLLVGVQGGGADEAGHGVADGVDAVGNLFQGVQLGGEADGGDGGDHQVSGIHQIADGQDHPAGSGRDGSHQHGHRRMHQLHHDHRANAPVKAELKADIAPQVEGLVGVIPPAGVVDLVQHPAPRQLDGAGEDHSPEKQQQIAVHQRGQEKQQRQHPEAVDGADRAVEKAPVYQLAGDKGGVNHLAAPAQKGINQKIKGDLIQGESKQQHTTASPPVTGRARRPRRCRRLRGPGRPGAWAPPR